VTEHAPSPSSRRDLLKYAAAGAGIGLGALWTGCGTREHAGTGAAGRRRLKAAFSNGGLTTTWCKLGHDAVMLWADLLDVDVTWIDGELNPQKQREKIELITDGDWDFCGFQALQSGILVDPVKQLKKRGIPVLSMDTLLTEKDQLRECGVWMQIASDHRKMAEASTQYLMDKIGGQGRVIHIGGSSAHSGARARNEGFNFIKAKYPRVEVLGGGVRWCDWKTEIARNSFESLLQQSDQPIAGAFFHNDDMALACIPALAGTPHEKMIITSIDGQKDGLTGIRDGLIAATAVNPGCMIHMMALVIGQFLVRNGEKIEDVPAEIPLPYPLVAKDTGNLEAMFFMTDPRHCLV
jgi:ribose transport system substrate-binding protein